MNRDGTQCCRSICVVTAAAAAAICKESLVAYTQLLTIVQFPLFDDCISCPVYGDDPPAYVGISSVVCKFIHATDDDLICLSNWKGV